MKARQLIRQFSIFAILTLALVLIGCKSNNQPKNRSSRPWNSPKGWESGVPGFLQNERRR